MKSCLYSQIETLAADLSDRPRGRLPLGEAAMLRAFFADELPDLWRAAAWPETCDNLEAVTLDASGCFALREGAADEIGDILWIGDVNPLTTPTATRVAGWTRLDNRVAVISEALATVYVDWQTPPPDLLDSSLDVEATLAAVELPARFRMPLAYRGAALLLATENPEKAAAYRQLADATLERDAARIKLPWWRQP